jgi:hypothetical protein
MELQEKTPATLSVLRRNRFIHARAGSIDFLTLLSTGADVEPFISPGFLELRGMHRFVMGQGSRTVGLTATDYVGPLGTAQDSGTENQYAAD